MVDDQESIRALIVLNLELEGFETVQAHDGRQCLDIVEQERPDLIVLDAGMPRLDGISTVLRLRAQPSTAHIPIVMVSAAAQGRDLARGAEAGVDAYITKPFEPEHLVSTVRALTERTGTQDASIP